MVSLSGLVTIILAASLTCIGNLLLRSGIAAGGGFAVSNPVDALMRFLALLLVPKFAIGFVVYFLAALLWFRVIATEPLSVAYPVMVATTFLMITVGAALAFEERVTWRLVIGMIVILLGIAVLAIDGKST
jgi:multidrug transporter EmrE-like cation transporter